LRDSEVKQCRSNANGLDIYYETAGTSAPLVLIHALPFDHNLWLYQVEAFSSHFRTIAMDLRGWGRSANPARRSRCATWATTSRRAGGRKVTARSSSGLQYRLECAHARVRSSRDIPAAILVGGNSDRSRSSSTASRPIAPITPPARWRTIT
jgi:hypothetical protein